MERPFIVDQNFNDQDYTTQALARADYEACTFFRCQFQKGFLDNQHFVDCEFVECDLTNTNIAHTVWNNVCFKDCKLLGLQFDTSDSKLLAFTFHACNLTLASFYNMQIPRTSFAHSNLSQVDFTETDLSEADFSQCNLHQAVFSRSQLAKANFTAAAHFSIDPNENFLSKTRFSENNLHGLLKKYDIVVE